MAITLPYALTAKTLARASQVMANFEALREALEGVGAAASGTDIYRKGVIGELDWAIESVAISSGTGELTIKTLENSAAWLPGPTGSLVRTFTPKQTYKLSPPALPGPGGYMKVGVEITASGASALVSVVSGSEQVSEAAAIAASPNVSAGKVRIRDLVVSNTGGYAKSAERDRRPWALGANSLRTATSSVQAEGTHPITGISQRLECSGRPVEMRYSQRSKSGAVSALTDLLFVHNALTVLEVATLPQDGVPVTAVFQPIGPGTHLFEVQTTLASGFGSLTLTEPTLALAEVNSFARNGTS